MKQINEKDELYIDSRLQEIEVEKENIRKIYDYYFETEENFSSDKIMSLVVNLNRRENAVLVSILVVAIFAK